MTLCFYSLASAFFWNMEQISMSDYYRKALPRHAASNERQNAFARQCPCELVVMPMSPVNANLARKRLWSERPHNW
jgi:hypothetical protein